MLYHLENQMVRAAKAGQAKRLTILDVCQSQLAVAGRSGAQQRRGFGIGQRIGDGLRKICRDDHILGVAAIDVSPGGFEFSAKVFVACFAMLAFTASREYPRHADTLTDFDL